MNATIEQTIVTIEEADSLIESLNLTEKVEDYEENEAGHVYTLVDGSTVTVVSSSQTVYSGNITATIEEADALIEALDLVEMVEHYELNLYGHVYGLCNGNSIAVIAPDACIVYGIE